MYIKKKWKRKDSLKSSSKKIYKTKSLLYKLNQKEMSMMSKVMILEFQSRLKKLLKQIAKIQEKN
jgi:hypothetical protein